MWHRYSIDPEVESLPELVVRPSLALLYLFSAL